MIGKTKYYPEIRDYCEKIPIVDCHDHSGECEPRYTDPIRAIKSGYFTNDIQSASSEKDLRILDDVSLSLEERWPILEKTWKRTCHTGYAQVTKRVLKKFYGEDELTLEALKRMQNKLLDLSDEKTFDSILEDANIAVRLVNRWLIRDKILDGSYKLTPRARIVISLSNYHTVRSYSEIQELIAPLNIHITSLDDYLDACCKIFDIQKKFGAVAFKDLSAYERTINFGNPSREEAEKLFNLVMEDPRRNAAYPDEIKPLGDYLFHAFMHMARDMDLPVQIHTGQLAHMRNDIVKTNAIGLTKIIELHRDVRFDLFHANWPYSGELLYLAKNYPNVAIDFCWTNIIDPVYCQNMFKQALSCVPHGKIHGYGSDFLGSVDRAWAHAQIARDNIAIALSDMVEMEYLGLDEAKEVAYAWLFANANDYFRLNL